jgi:hypothetical protein
MRSIFFLLALALVLAGPVAEARLLPFEVGADWRSDFYWRGMTMTESSVLQPWVSAPLGASGLSVTAWGSFALQDRDVHEQADRIDLTLGWRRGLGVLWKPLYVTAGFTNYWYPHVDEDGTTQEVYVGAGAALPFVDTSLTAYRDVNVLDATYLRWRFSPPLVNLVPMSRLDVDLAWSDYPGDWGFHDAEARLSVGVSLLGKARLAALVGWVYTPDRIETDNSKFFYGVGVEAGF